MSVYMDKHKSELISMAHGVLQRSVFGPLLFNLDMLPQIMHDNNIAYHAYEDDTQMYLVLTTKRLCSIRLTLSVLGASESLDAIKLPSFPSRQDRNNSIG